MELVLNSKVPTPVDVALSANMESATFRCSTTGALKGKNAVCVTQNLLAGMFRSSNR